jgi:hypothetical protein
MKTKKAELGVDFIGGQGLLTKEEELAISNFIKSRKSLKLMPPLRNEKKRSGKKQIT